MLKLTITPCITTHPIQLQLIWGPFLDWVTHETSDSNYVSVPPLFVRTNKKSRLTGTMNQNVSQYIGFQGRLQCPPWLRFSTMCFTISYILLLRSFYFGYRRWLNTWMFVHDIELLFSFWRLHWDIIVQLLCVGENEHSKLCYISMTAISLQTHTLMSIQHVLLDLQRDCVQILLLQLCLDKPRMVLLWFVYSFHCPTYKIVLSIIGKCFGPDLVFLYESG